MKLSLLFLSATLTSAIVVQPPLGRYGVASTVIELVDTSRNDTYAPKPQSRRIMVSAFYPVNSLKRCQPVMLPYMPPATAAVYDKMCAPIGIPNGTFGFFELSTCAFNRKDRSRGPNSFPVVLFSPGLGNFRLLYGAMAQSLASHGYVVITMDHAYDANIFEYPDKFIALAVDISTTEQITADVLVRQHDVSFLVDQLHDCSIRHQLFHDIASSKSLKKILTMGHSLGGATAAAAMLADHRIAAAVNFDGTMFGDVLNEGLRSPFMIMSHQGKNLTTDPSWTQVWPKVTGSELAVTLNGTVHGSYTDLTLLANTLGLSAKTSAQVEELLGTMDGKTAMENINAFVGQFFKFVERKTKNLLPSDMAKKFPQATVLDKHVCR
ncbi:alpha/beta-hydrolase [Aureobasidium sp. EXF-12298]|nr:alpha/beta-hydrolase [Aureobasidium sp. EXF-12298]KAI4758341.1 alpha/beta-hydrolase [Aureobasidium sp. EXF-12344]KAI4779111.1 alpha/beta-hydrolase [Aureobasidium sp. EXF-3400]